VNKRLTEAEELPVCMYLKRLDTIGTSARLPMVTNCANDILKRNHPSGTSDPPPTVSEVWSKRFLARHPEFHIRKQKAIEEERKNAHDPGVILDWFARYQQVCEESGVLEGDRYNFDETGFRIGIGRNQWIVTMDPDRQAYLGSTTNRELVTSCEAISGDGYALPPMLILPGTLHLQDWTTKTNLDDNVLLAVSDTGYSNDRLALEWISHFDRFSAPRSTGAHRLLLLDGHGSHCTREFISYCDEKKIIPFCLPPHTTHLLQPLDVVVFQPLKHYHAEAIDHATRTGCSDFNKIEFLAAITSIRAQAFKKSTIVSAFRKTGLIPYNPQLILSQLPIYTPPSPSYNPPTTPPPIIPEVTTTPHTVHSLQQHAAYLRNQDPVSPTFQRNLNQFIKGSLAQAQAGAQAYTDLSNTKAAEQARTLRQDRTRRSVQKGGVIYTHQARAIVKTREEDDAQKRIELAEREVEKLKKDVIRERKKMETYFPGTKEIYKAAEKE